MGKIASGIHRIWPCHACLDDEIPCHFDCSKGCLARVPLRMLGEIVEEGNIGSTMDAVLASAVARSALATASSVLPFSRCAAGIKTFHLIRVS